MGFSARPRGQTDAFLTLVRSGSVSFYTLGGAVDGDIKTRDDRADIAANPLRVSEDYLDGVSSRPRFASEYVSAMKVGPDGKLYVALIFRGQISLNTQNPRGFVIKSNGDYDLFDSAVLRYSIGSKLAFESVIQIGGPFNDVVNDIGFRCQWQPRRGWLFRTPMRF